MCPAAKAEIREQALRIPTYHVGEDPNPPLFAAWDPWVYPYPKQDDILRPKDEATAYQAVVMENPYLRVTVLPQLGGRVYSAYDKTLGRELFHKPKVIKPTLIGLRGAWICGGIEFNLIKGHHVLTFSPVDHLTRQHADGSVSVTVGHMERRSRARWSVTLTLRPDRAYLQVDLKLYNRHRYALDFYQWSNSAVPAQEDLIFPYATEHMISSGRTLYRFPQQGGADISRWTSIPIAHDLFSIGSDADFMGIYYEKSDVGMVHYANHHMAPGKKLFTWGTDGAGRIWDQLLTDDDIPYIEPQAGCVLDQSTFLFLQPHQSVEWREYWWGIHGMGGYKQVNAEAALNLAPVGESQTRVAANTTGALKKARLKLTIGDEVAHQTTLDIDPNTPYSAILDVPYARWRYAETTLTLHDAAGREIIRYHQPAPDMFQKVELPAPFQPEVETHSSAEELVIAAREAEKLRDYERAEALYQQALQVDAGYAQALAGLGARLSQQGRYREAYNQLMRAIRRDPDLGLAHYHLGLVCRELGDLKAARDHFWAARLDPAWNAQSFYYLGEMAVAVNQWSQAVEMLQRSLALNYNHTKAHDMLALALRLLGEAEDAEVVLHQVLEELDRPDILAQAELWRLQGSQTQKQTLLERLGGDEQLLLELAQDYMGVTRWQDAIEMLLLWPGLAEGAPANPLLYYALAYAYDKRGMIEDARRAYAVASQQSGERAFAHRLEELAMLGRALEVNPKDARAHALLGTWLYALRRKEEALEHWRQALALQPDAVTWRNLGKALWKDQGDLAGARAAYEQAVALNPQDYRLFADLADILAEQGGADEERVALLRGAPAHGRVQARLAQALADMRRWDEAIAVLQAMVFDPYEGERGTRPAYYDAYVERGLLRYEAGDLVGALRDFEAALEYPLNVGVGRSYYAQDVKALWFAGLVADAMGEHDKAQQYWRAGADINLRTQHGLQSPLEGYQPEARAYRSLCLQRLGRANEAACLF